MRIERIIRSVVHQPAVLAMGLLCTSPLPAREPITVVARTIHEDSIEAVVIRFSLDGDLLLQQDTQTPARIPADEIVSIRSTASPLVRKAGDVTLILSTGDRLHGTLTGGVAETVTIDTLELGRQSFPIERITRLDGVHVLGAGFQATLDWFNHMPLAQEDAVLLSNSDTVRGFITTLGSDGLTIESELGESTLRYGVIVAARFASAAPTKLPARYAVVTTRVSGRIFAKSVEWANEEVQIQLIDGRSITLEARRIVSIDLVGGRWQWLSEHQPISFEHTPMLSLSWPYVLNRNVRGKKLSVAGRTFDRGIGVHSRSVLSYDLKGQYKTFVTSFGIDDDSGPYADVTVSILVDGRLRLKQENVRRGKLLGPIRLDVTRAKRIELMIDFGANGDIQDRFDWIEPAVIR